MSDNIPEELKGKKCWLLWRYEEVHGRMTKIPYNTAGNKAAVTDLSNCAVYDEVKKVVADYSGVGISLDALDLIAIDIDHCIKDGLIAPQAVEIIRAFPTYTEISPSGEGLRLLCKGVWTTERCRAKITKGIGLEIYQTKRYVTITGNKLLSGIKTIAQCEYGLKWIYKKYLKEKEIKKVKETKKELLTDKEIVDIIMRGEDGRRFYNLFYRGSGSFDKSICDYALCAIIARVTQNRIQVERIFNSSRLIREKWTKRHDYRERTITRAMEEANA